MTTIHIHLFPHWHIKLNTLGGNLPPLRFVPMFPVPGLLSLGCCWSAGPRPCPDRHPLGLGFSVTCHPLKASCWEQSVFCQTRGIASCKKLKRKFRCKCRRLSHDRSAQETALWWTKSYVGHLLMTQSLKGLLLHTQVVFLEDVRPVWEREASYVLTFYYSCSAWTISMWSQC